METGLLSAKSIDSLRLAVTQIRMALKSVKWTGIDVDALQGGGVGGEVRQQGVQMTVGERFIGQLCR